MRYEKPEIEIEKFSILEDITAEGTSGIDIPIIDESNEGDINIESIGEVLSNIFTIK